LDSDLALVVGLIVAGLSVISFLSALSERRSLRAALPSMLLAAAFLSYAWFTSPAGYSISDIDDVFYGVVARFLP